MRFLTPSLFGLAALYVHWYNGAHREGTIVFPGMDLLDPAASGNVVRQGQLTVYLLLGLTALFAFGDAVAWLRNRVRG